MVMRPDIVSARMASPSYSSTLPVPPAVPISRISRRMKSLAVTHLPGCAGEGGPHRAALALPQGLRGQHVLDLARADAEGQRAEGAVRRRVRIAADHRRPGQGQPQLRRHDVHHARSRDRRCRTASGRIPCSSSSSMSIWALAIRSMMFCGSTVGTLWSMVAMFSSRTAHLAPRQPQPLERLGARHLVHELAVHVQQRRPVRLFADHVPRPNLVI